MTDRLFQENEFFDARDLVQVKYEMLRRVRVERVPVSQSAAAFGFSRPSYYQAQMAFEKRACWTDRGEEGPRQAHKLNTEVLDFVVQAQAVQPAPGFGELAQMIEERFGFPVHPRSIQRALSRRKKNV